MERTALPLALLFFALSGISPAGGQQFSIDSSEQQAIENTTQFALENNRTNEAASWVNPDTGTSGASVPVRTYQNVEGEYCREYLQTIIIGGKAEQGYGTACRQPDGTWRTVPGETAAAPSAAQVVEKRYYRYDRYPDYYRYPYYYYPYPYFPANILFSFGFFHHDGHHFKGHHFKGGHHSNGHGHFGGHRGGHGGHWKGGGHGGGHGGGRH